MDNLEIYNKVKDVPAEAKKKISGGRLNGMTDINPMWRIKKMTEVFGVAGVGWCSEITHTQIDEGSSGEKMISVFVNVYVKQGNEWSKPVPGVGGAMLIAKESAGLRLDDEAYKKAYTDALSVAFKAFGVGASVYFEKDPDGKYETEVSAPPIKRAYDNSEVKEKPKTENKPSSPQKAVEDYIKALLHCSRINTRRICLPNLQTMKRKSFLRFLKTKSRRKTYEQVYYYRKSYPITRIIDNFKRCFRL